MTKRMWILKRMYFRDIVGMVIMLVNLECYKNLENKQKILKKIRRKQEEKQE